MASSFFFAGRLWTTPSVMSAVNDSAMQPASLTVGNVLCIIGESSGGQPLTALPFGNPSDALATLISGPLCDAVVRAFAPSPQTNSPSTIIAMRVGQATQATLSIVDGVAAPVIDLTTNQYGLTANLTSVKISAGSSVGKAITVSNGNTFYTQDNIARNAFSVHYTGAQASATVAVTNTTVVLAAPSGTPVATLDLNTYATVAQLVAAINGVAGFQGVILDGLSGTSVTLNGLDALAATDCKGATVTVAANLQAIIDWFNSPAEQFVTAVRHAGAGTVPALLATTFMSGGTSPTSITQDWTNALTVLQTQDVQWIAPMSGDPAIHAAVDAHVQFMSTAGRKERRAVVGPVSGTTVSGVQALPVGLNSDRTMLVYPGYYAFNAQGKRTLYDPFQTAALIAAGFAGMNPGDAMTNKALAVNGLELALKDPVDTDSLIQSGVCCVMQQPQGFMVARSVSTWTVNNNFNRVEMSCGAAVDFVMRNVRNALQPLKGGRQDPINLGRAVSLTETVLASLSIPEPQGPGTLVGNAASPPYRGITATMTGDVLSVSFQCSPVIPTNFIPITVAIVPFSGTSTSSAGAASFQAT